MNTPGFQKGLTMRVFVGQAGLSLSERQLGSAGQEAAKRCRERGITPGRSWDGKHDANYYPFDILNEMLPGLKAMAAAGSDATEGPIPGGLWWRSHVAWTEAGR